jgi:hypothetical protein
LFDAVHGAYGLRRTGHLKVDGDLMKYCMNQPKWPEVIEAVKSEMSSDNISNAGYNAMKIVVKAVAGWDVSIASCIGL